MYPYSRRKCPLQKLRGERVNEILSLSATATLPKLFLRLLSKEIICSGLVYWKANGDVTKVFSEVFSFVKNGGKKIYQVYTFFTRETAFAHLPFQKKKKKKKEEKTVTKLPTLRMYISLKKN